GLGPRGCRAAVAGNDGAVRERLPPELRGEPAADRLPPRDRFAGAPSPAGGCRRGGHARSRGRRPAPGGGQARTVPGPGRARRPVAAGAPARSAHRPRGRSPAVPRRRPRSLRTGVGGTARGGPADGRPDRAGGAARNAPRSLDHPEHLLVGGTHRVLAARRGGARPPRSRALVRRGRPARSRRCAAGAGVGVTTPIADYAIVGDGRSAALISRAGSLDWLCWPRFDSPSIFAAILDEERGGRFSVAPDGPYRSTRAYLGETNVLETRFLTASGELALTDFMPVRSGIDSARSMYPGHELVRVVRCKRGAVDVAIVFDPRPDYGRRKAAIRTMGKLGLRVDCGGDAILTLLTDAPLGAEGRARVRLRGDEEIHFSLSYACGAPAMLPPPTRDRSAAVLARALQLWREWASRTKYEGPARDLVVRSALVFKLLQYAPSGAIVAAPTTSLPERPGGHLNWDYRFCWLRDAALTARALFGLGHQEEAENFMSWLLTATNLSLPRLHVLYDLFGRQPRGERELRHL